LRKGIMYFARDARIHEPEAMGQLRPAMRPANYAEWRKQQIANAHWDAELMEIRVKERVIDHVKGGPAREREALKRA